MPRSDRISGRDGLPSIEGLSRMQQPDATTPGTISSDTNSERAAHHSTETSVENTFYTRTFYRHQSPQRPLFLQANDSKKKIWHRVNFPVHTKPRKERDSFLGFVWTAPSCIESERHDLRKQPTEHGNEASVDFCNPEGTSSGYSFCRPVGRSIAIQNIQAFVPAGILLAD